MGGSHARLSGSHAPSVRGHASARRSHAPAGEIPVSARRSPAPARRSSAPTGRSHTRARRGRHASVTGSHACVGAGPEGEGGFGRAGERGLGPQLQHQGVVEVAEGLRVADLGVDPPQFLSVAGRDDPHQLPHVDHLVLRQRRLAGGRALSGGRSGLG